MPRKILPRITAVAPAGAPLTVQIAWSHGGSDTVDLSSLVGAFAVYAPLRDDPSLFATVEVGEFGTDIVWADGIDMSNDSLWRLTQEQSGATMTAEAFRSWRERHRFTLDTAARMLGVSRRMVAYYDQGKKPIPRVVALATRGLEQAY